MKKYWSILKAFANRRKVPVTPPLMIDSKFIFSFKTKVNYFNSMVVMGCLFVWFNLSLKYFGIVSKLVTSVSMEEG